MATKIIKSKPRQMWNKEKNRAIFITLEGLEGSGKSSVISFLERYLKNKGLSVKVFREPGSTKIGEKIREILLDKKNKISAWAELLLYLAARTQLIEEKFIKVFKKYDVVICDRFYDSTIVYQGYGLGLGKVAKRLAKQFSLGVKPDLTIILDSNIKKSLARIKNKDRVESRPLSFHCRLRRGYKELAKKEPWRIKVINADRELNRIYEDVAKLTERLLNQCSPTKKF